MANRLRLFIDAEDELLFLRTLEPLALDVYPRRVPPQYKPMRAGPAVRDSLPGTDLYLHAASVGPAIVDPVKRGPDKGHLRINEVLSPVIFWERSTLNEDGELLSGQLWAELEPTQQTGRRQAAPDQFRRMFLDLDSWLKKAFRKGDPKDFWVGPSTARAVKQTGLVLRDSDHRGGTVRVHG